MNEDNKIKYTHNISKNNSLTMNNSYNKNLIIHYIKNLYLKRKKKQEN